MPRPILLNLLVAIALLAPANFPAGGTIPARASGADASDPQAPGDTLILFVEDAAARDLAVETLSASGAPPYALIGSRAAYARMTPEQAAAARALPGVARVVPETAGAVDPAIAGDDVNLTAAILAWNARRLPSPALSREISGEPPEPLINDRLIPPDDPAARRTTGDLQPAPQAAGGESEAVSAAADAPTAWQTSEFMAGKIVVDVFLPESTGSAENWSPTMVNNVVGEVTAGITWWGLTQTQGGRPSAGITFDISFFTPFNSDVSVDFEPIQLSQAYESEFITQILGRRGFSGDHFSAARSYADARRRDKNADWAYTVWVINSFNDPDGKFADGYFAYAYLHGPFAVMTYDNNGWGISQMEVVIAHETGHIFGADDEYWGSPCVNGATYGYLGVANTNCENSSGYAPEHSIMRGFISQTAYAYPGNLASTSVRGQVGFRDSDGDSIYDPLDTLSLSLMTPSPNPTADPTPTLSGSAVDTPFPSPLRFSTSINFITGVQMRVDGGEWFGCSAVDGAWGGASESFTCTTPELEPGEHTAEARAVGRYGSYSATVERRFTVDPPGPPGAFGLISPAAGATGQPIDPVLTWGESEYADRYEYCLVTGAASACSPPAAWQDAGEATSVALSGLEYETEYSWQVRAVNPIAATEAGGGWRSFTTRPAPPGAFSKTTPLASAAGSATDLTLAWSAAANTDDYEICFDRTFDSECGGAWISTANETSYALTGLDPTAAYHWQVRAVGPGGTTYADGGAWFVFYTAAAPGDFNKFTPLDAIGGVSTTPALSWEALPGAVEYRYCLDPILNGICSGTPVSAGLELGAAPPALAPGVSYEWQVFAVLESGELIPANGGRVWTFTVDGVPWIYLPLMFKPAFANGVYDGGFETLQNGSWSETSTLGTALVRPASGLPEGIKPHAGERAAWLGGARTGTFRLWQRVTVPKTDSARLTFWYRIASDSPCGYDTARVRLGPTQVARFDLCAYWNTAGWKKASIPVGAYGGRSLNLEFGVYNTERKVSSFFVDDVGFVD